MGANVTQAQALVLFLIGFVFIAAGIAASMIYIVLGVVLIGASGALFLKCKPWEHQE